MLEKQFTLMSGVCIVILLMVLAHTDASQDGSIREFRNIDAKGPVRSNSDDSDLALGLASGFLYGPIAISFSPKPKVQCSYIIAPAIPGSSDLKVGGEKSYRIILNHTQGGLCKEPSKDFVTFRLVTFQKLRIKGLFIPNDKVKVPTQGEGKIIKAHGEQVFSHAEIYPIWPLESSSEGLSIRPIVHLLPLVPSP
eukprot:Nk52_evm1s2501 gene=Nk52_evmTU1s2501